jgi:hypothetical protein
LAAVTPDLHRATTAGALSQVLGTLRKLGHRRWPFG